MKIIAIWLCLYATLSNPFLISSYVPLFLRTILEGGLLYLLVIYFLFSKTLRFTVVAISIWLMIFLLTLIGVDGYVNSLISTVFKFAILIMVVPLSKESTLFVNVIRKYWIFIWSLASISVLLIFFNTTFKIFNIEQFFFSEVNELAPYVYEGNFLGFFTP